MTITQPTWVFGYGSLIWKQDFPYLESGGVKGVVYRAAENNVAYLGPAPLSEMAAQINRCAGPSGPWAILTFMFLR